MTSIYNDDDTCYSVSLYFRFNIWHLMYLPCNSLLQPHLWQLIPLNSLESPHLPTSKSASLTSTYTHFQNYLLPEPIMNSTVLRISRGSHLSKSVISPYRPKIHPSTLFSTTKWRSIRTTEMSEQQLAAVKIDRDRLWRDLHETCEWGKGERWGE